mgnify:CR=1 FL=1
MPIIHSERESEGMTDGQRLNRSLGPFYSPDAVIRKLSVDPDKLGEMARTGQIIALKTEEGNIVYPKKQFLRPTKGTFDLSPAVAAAFSYLMEHDEELSDVVCFLYTPYGLLETMAGALFRQDENGEMLLTTLQQNLDNPEHESWKKLLDLDGVVSGVRKVLATRTEDI